MAMSRVTDAVALEYAFDAREVDAYARVRCCFIVPLPQPQKRWHVNLKIFLGCPYQMFCFHFPEKHAPLFSTTP